MAQPCEHLSGLASGDFPPQRTPDACEECGRASEWPASQMGTTQDCPHCGAYMDIPDPEENWDEADFEEGEGEEGKEEDAK